jgi:HSP20 family protein
MANEEKSTKKKEIAPARSERWLSPFEEAEHWFEDFFPRGWMRPLRQGWPSWPDLEAPFKGRMPRVDIIDRENEIVVRAELPGVDKDDLDVSMTDHSVTIRATTSCEKKEAEGEYYRREMSRGEFQRTLPLPEEVDADKAKASFKDGVLELALPKVKSAKRKTIKVE